MLSTSSKRPRNVGIFQAAAILYGDWGTSKAYVIGLAFALAGYSSFWLIAAVGLLSLLVGSNYITICKSSPNGGGVYANARRHSEVLALLGAFFLIADYLITAALSAQSSFEYLGVAYPQYWAMSAILLVGIINFLGPKHSGNLAIFIAIPTVIVVILLFFVTLPFAGEALRNVQPLTGGFLANWSRFVGIIVALAGVEAIANTTGVMRLDPGTTEQSPSVSRTSKRALILVMLEVSFFTTFFGLIVNAIPNLYVDHEKVMAPEAGDIRDAMLKYMGNFFLSQEISPVWGTAFGAIIGLVFAVLLLSAVNTAIVAFISLIFVMSRDGEMPASFQKINRFGVPIYPLLFATLGPMIVLVFVHDVAGLAHLYGVGFVGAIAMDLGINGFDKNIAMKKWERYTMCLTFFYYGYH